MKFWITNGQEKIIVQSNNNMYVMTADRLRHRDARTIVPAHLQVMVFMQSFQWAVHPIKYPKKVTNLPVTTIIANIKNISLTIKYNGNLSIARHHPTNIHSLSHFRQTKPDPHQSSFQ
jgi:hypothetical protein